MTTHRSLSTKIRRAVLALLLCLAFISGGIYLLRESLLLTGIRFVLLDSGIQVHELKGFQMRSDTLQIASLQFSLPGADAYSSVEGVQVDFTARQLLKGQLQSLQIRRAMLLPATAQTTHDASVIAADIAQSLALLMQFPIAQVQIDSLQLPPWTRAASIELASQTRELTASVQEDSVRAELRVNWHDSNYVSSLFIPETDLSLRSRAVDAVSANLMVSNDLETALSVEMSLLQTDNALLLDMEGNASLAPLTQLVGNTGIDISAFVGLSGELALRGAASLSSTAASPHQASLQLMPALITLPVRSQLVAVQLEQLSIQGQCTGHGTCTLTQESALTANAESVLAPPPGRTNDAAVKTLQFNGLQLRSAGELQFDAGGLRVGLDAGSHTALSMLKYGALEARNLTIQATQPLHLYWDTADAWSVEGGGVRLHLPLLRNNDLEAGADVTLSNLAAAGSASALRPTMLQADSHWQSLSSNALPVTLRNPEVTAHLALAGNELSLTGALQIATRHLLDADISFDLALAQGAAALSIPEQQFDSGAASFSALFVAPPFAADIVGGKFTANAQLQLQNYDNTGIVVEGPVHVALQDLSGFVGEVAILGASLSAEAALTQSVDLRTTTPARLTIASIDPGIPVQEIQMLLDVDTAANTLAITDLSATLFGGSVSSAGSLFALDKPEGTMQLQLLRINIADILTLSAYEGVAATGLISGTLPASLRANALSIAGGSLFAEAPGGNIRYAGTGSATGNAALDFVNKTLSNYQYDSMESGVDYLPNGDLALSVRLQGVNPDTNPGQRIHLNLNISDNIPTLLRSLQAGRTITDAVEQQLQRR